MCLEDSVFLTSPNGQAGGNQGLREAVGLDQRCIAREQDIPSLLSPFSGGQEGSQPGPGQRWPLPQLSRSLERLPPEGDSDSTLWHCAPCSSMTSFYFANYSYKPVPQLFPSFISVCVWGGGAHTGHREQVAVRGQPWMLVLTTYLCLVHCS